MTLHGGPREQAEVVLSAESTTVGLRRVPRERVRVRREVVTEEVTVVVAVRREVLRVEAEPLDGRLDDALDVSGASSTPAPPLPLELVLSEERPVVGLEVVPYERVHVGVRRVEGAAQVRLDERREVLDVTTDEAVRSSSPGGAP
ncbi:DUF2382 domain-containing protein [Quadrisphaera sp. KR29]|uniref:DUF2382 domain-containing protein n=1 Tax=Quadrisphaera sp. KR29 TaxID=3461391 RepID=UPI004043D357